MPVSPSAPARPRQALWPFVLPAIIAFTYGCGHLLWYQTTPLGQVPVLDEQENLALAEAIAQGNLPREPFYRALGYPLCLAALRLGGVPAHGLFSAALLLGVVLHSVNAALVGGLARRLFGGHAGLIAGLLFALHPVLVHYSTQALDAVPALTLFLLGCRAVVPTLSPRAELSSPVPWVVGSVSWAIATVMRPNYLLVWCALPLLAWRAVTSPRKLSALLAALSGAVIFGAVALWQWRVSGAAGFLPWQGAYNLWAANQPGSHGRYYVQQMALPAAVARQNPARAESLYLYQHDTGLPAPDIRTLNTHWRARFLAHVRQEPGAWLGLLARKSYALVNQWEQYNNKTFAFHQARSPWLRWNPIGWGVVFVLGAAGLFRLAVVAPPAALALTVILAAAAASIVLFFVSARFRLPLAALGTVLAGGALADPVFWRAWPRRRQWALAAALALAAAVTFSAFDRVRGRATYVQDHALLARAADTVGDDLLAWREAVAALALQPMHRDALRLAVAAYFNRLVFATAIPDAEGRWREICTRFLTLPENDARDLQAVAALALWRAGQTEAALAAWRKLDATPSAVAARLLARDVRPSEFDAAVWKGPAWNEPLVRLAAARFNLPAPAGVTLDDASRAEAIIRQVFTPEPPPDQPR